MTAGVYRLWSNLDNIRSAGELMLLCAVFQGTLVQEVYVHSFNQDERAQISAGRTNRKDVRGYTRRKISNNDVETSASKSQEIAVAYVNT